MLWREKIDGKICQKTNLLKKSQNLKVPRTSNFLKYEGPKFVTGSKEQCAICTVPIDYSDFEEILDKNEFSDEFLRNYHAKLVHYLMEVFCLNKPAIECFLIDEFYYSGRDWNTGERWSIPLKGQIEYRQTLKQKNPDTYFKIFYWVRKKTVL